MALVTIHLDPNAAGTTYTDNEIVAKINAASAQITRATAIAAAALESGAAKANLDAMADAERGYTQTAPAAEEHRIISIQRTSAGKLLVVYA